MPLLKSHIKKDIVMHSDEWFATRLAKLTASENHHLCGEKFPSAGALSYIYRKVGEELSGLPCRDEIDTEGTRHGNFYELDSIKIMAEERKLDFLVTQKLVHEPGSRFSCTPDAIIVLSETSDGLGYNVEPIEAKNPKTFDGYITLARCKTPKDLKAVRKDYYWQVMDQIDNCGALRGWFIAHHPDFKVGMKRIIEFRIMEKDEKGCYPLSEELRFLQSRKKQAVELFNKVREEMFNL